ncbi:unnamed protein product [Acanthoscelides obtectus]|uniref:Uncharacterized protein n=1 Tax=Acanthoscelides obtectus TaxID=200917 RepID=A0A9P0JLU7_ACAOB|nr:unnamed protein product [Acanthoscelides obtectus]CAK1628997.1 hypothetical protein AOBTE_LOCUS5520 [Acanthoscelides obtectus]
MLWLSVGARRSLTVERGGTTRRISRSQNVCMLHAHVFPRQSPCGVPPFPCISL